MKRDFEYKGIKFHINDNRIGISKSNYEFFPKYNLLTYIESFGRWQSCGKFDSKREMMEYIKREYVWLK